MTLFTRPAYLSRTFAIFYITFSFFFSCNSGTGKTAPTKLSEKPKKPFQLEQPVTDQFVAIDDSLTFKIAGKNKVKADSLEISIEGVRRYTEYNSPLEFSTKNLFVKVGRQNLRINIFYQDSLTQTIITRINVLSDIEPENLSYKVIRKIPHNESDFIQGLIYYEGYLYEGTGREFKSRLIKTDPSDGSVIHERKLADQFFGEGITRVDDKLYQLTYRHKVGFVYDLETFEQLREFDLQTMEGWGLTYDGENLIVSDGSSQLYFYDPEYFSQIKQLDVANDRGLVTNLNELEYTNNVIWANVYTKSIIVKIDAQTGKVLAQLNLEELYPETVPRDYDHVLNGIAYRSDTDTYFVTGKLWPVIYEIKIYE